MTKEELLKDLIIERYGSVRQFALKIRSYPNSLSKQLKENDLANIKTETLLKICDTLDIDLHFLLKGQIVRKQNIEFVLSNEEYEFLHKYHELKEEDRDDIKFLIDRKLKRQQQTEEENKAS